LKNLSSAKSTASVAAHPRNGAGGGNSTPLLVVATREPQQGRSRESFARMISAAEKLLKANGNDNFTLNEVSEVGKVSIGSIYCRFSSKEELIHAVQIRAMARIEKDQCDVIAKAAASTNNLSELIVKLVDGLAESFRRHAPLLRPMMHRAGYDPDVAEVGRQSYLLVTERVHAALLEYRDEIAQPDPERAVRSAYRIMYGALARYLGFGTEMEAALQGSWIELKEDLGWMCAAFLMTKPRRCVPDRTGC